MTISSFGKCEKTNEKVHGFTKGRRADIAPASLNIEKCIEYGDKNIEKCEII